MKKVLFPHTVTLDEYKTELANQTEIYSMTAANLEPLCPAVLYSEIFPHENISELTSVLKLTLVNHKEFLIYNYEQIGIIVMEFAEDYVRMDKLLDESNQTDKICALMSAAFLLIDLAAKTGYTHVIWNLCI